MPKWRHKLALDPGHCRSASASRCSGACRQGRCRDARRTTRRCSGEFDVDPGLHIKAQNYFDLAATYTLWDHVNLRAGVNNIFDNDPPLITGGSAVRTARTSARPVRATATPIRAPGMRSAACSGSARRSTSVPPKRSAAAAAAAAASASAAACYADVPGWLGDPGDRSVPGSAASAAAAAAGARARLSEASHLKNWAAGLRPAAFFYVFNAATSCCHSVSIALHENDDCHFRSRPEDRRCNPASTDRCCIRSHCRRLCDRRAGPWGTWGGDDLPLFTQCWVCCASARVISTRPFRI